MEWKKFEDEVPRERPGTYILLGGHMKEPEMLRWSSVYEVWEGDWPGEGRSLADVLRMFDDGDRYTHWALVTRP